MKRTLAVGATLAGLVAAVLSCAKPPTMEMDAARAAVQAARQAEAQAYAPQTLAEAESLLRQAEENVTNKKYEPARNQALQAKSTAEQAQQQAVQGKEQARGEAEVALAAAREAVGSVKTALETGPVMRKAAKEDVEVLQANVSQVEGLLAAADAAMGQGNYLGVKDQALAIKQSAESVTVAIEDALEKGKKTYETRHEGKWYMKAEPR